MLNSTPIKSIFLPLLVAVTSIGYGTSFLNLFFSVLIYAYCVFIHKSFYILAPFVLMPFAFVLRANSNGELLFSILPDIAVIVTIAIWVVRRRFDVVRDRIAALLLFFVIAVCTLHLIRIMSFDVVFIVIRQYAIPVFFIITFIDISKVYPRLPFVALELSALAYFSLSVLAFLNYTGLFQINQSIPELYPYLNYKEYVGAAVNADAMSRSDVWGFGLPRFNLMLGGSLGSSAALLMCFSLSFFLGLRPVSTFFSVCISLIFFMFSVLTISASSVFPIILLIFLFLHKYLDRRILFSIFLVSVFFLLNFSTDLTEYFYATSMQGILLYLGSINLFEFFIGVGPGIFSMNYSYVPDNYPIDVGIFRVFVESGVVLFSLYSIFLLYLAVKFFSEKSSIPLTNSRLYIFFVFTFLSLVHGNIPLQMPFYPLFACCVAGLWPKKLEF